MGVARVKLQSEDSQDELQKRLNVILNNILGLTEVFNWMNPP
jgi:hypothetical protein